MKELKQMFHGLFKWAWLKKPPWVFWVRHTSANPGAIPVSHVNFVDMLVICIVIFVYRQSRHWIQASKC